MKRYVVTGGAGFIGSHVSARLLRNGDEVIVLDNLSTGSLQNLDSVREEVGESAAKRLRLLEGSVTDAELVMEAMSGAHGAVHLAALPSVVRSVENPIDSHHNNVTGTVTVLDAARQNGVRVVYAGSSSAYGDQEVPLKHEQLRERPLSPYAASKLAGELYARSFARVYQLPVVVTRFFNVYGPRQVPDSPYSGVIAAFCFAFLKGKAPRVDGDGLQSRDFTYVEDVAHGIQRALEVPLEQTDNLVNLAGGKNYSLLDLLDSLRRLTGRELEPAHGPGRTGDVRHSQADTGALNVLLDFVPATGLDDGIEATYRWYEERYR